MSAAMRGGACSNPWCSKLRCLVVDELAMRGMAAKIFPGKESSKPLAPSG